MVPVPQCCAVLFLHHIREVRNSPGNRGNSDPEKRLVSGFCQIVHIQVLSKNFSNYLVGIIRELPGCIRAVFGSTFHSRRINVYVSNTVLPDVLIEVILEPGGTCRLCNLMSVPVQKIDTAFQLVLKFAKDARHLQHCTIASRITGYTRTPRIQMGTDQQKFFWLLRPTKDSHGLREVFPMPRRTGLNLYRYTLIFQAQFF